MKIPLSWLQKFLHLPHSPEELTSLLNNLGIEVDEVSKTSLPFSGIVVGKVRKASPHPQADTLTLALVDDGNEEFPVVCGAPNCRAGITVAFAKIGAKIEDTKTGEVLKIKKAKLRGETSFGMLCAESELGFGEESDGIMELDDALEAGTSLEDLYAETILEVSLTPNLAHCFSLLGIARELSAKLKTPLNPLPWEEKNYSFTQESSISCTIEAAEDCSSYHTLEIDQISPKPSPKWLQDYLLSCGMRSINHIVDITNFVMLQYGQPLHAFDADKISGDKLIVRKSFSNEHLRTLDGKEHSLPEGILLIADAKGPLAAAGVMGGEESEVSESSSRIILEAAHFSPTMSRKTAKALQCSTESSKRFERGVDPFLAKNAINLAAKLITEIGGGEAKSPKQALGSPIKAKEISCSLSKINDLLGTEFQVTQIKELLKQASCSITQDGELFSISVPSYRYDLSLPVDIIEEVARLHGYENIPKPKASFSLSSIPDDTHYLFEKKLRTFLIQAGLSECLGCDLISPKEQFFLFPEEGKQALPLSNAHSEEQSSLRASLLSNALHTLHHNFNHQQTSLQGFEIGHTYSLCTKEHSHKETSSLSLTMCGMKKTSSWLGEGEEINFFDLKGLLETLFFHLHLPQANFSKLDSSLFHPGQAAKASIQGTTIAVLGKLHPKLIEDKLSSSKAVYYAELNLDLLQPLQKHMDKATPLPTLPSSERDWTLSLKKDAPVGEVLQVLQALKHKILESVSFVSLYEGDSLGHEKKNATFRFIYRDWKKTLSQENVEKAHASLSKHAEKLLASYLMD